MLLRQVVFNRAESAATRHCRSVYVAFTTSRLCAVPCTDSNSQLCLSACSFQSLQHAHSPATTSSSAVAAVRISWANMGYVHYFIAAPPFPAIHPPPPQALSHLPPPAAVLLQLSGTHQRPSS
jgi:hypothetical protein